MSSVDITCMKLPLLSVFLADQTDGKTAAGADNTALSRALIAAICASCGVIVCVKYHILYNSRFDRS